jgi:hypothetical protein
MKNFFTIYRSPLILACVSCILLAGVAGPAMAEIGAIAGRIAVLREQAASTIAREKEVLLFKQQYEEYRPLLEQLERYFIDYENPLELIQFIESVAQDAGVQVSIALMPAQSQAKGNLFFSLEVEGSFDAIMKFLERTQTGPYLAAIERLTISNSAVVKDQQSNRDVLATIIMTAEEKNPQ